MDCDIQIFDKVICEYKTLAEFTADTVAGPMKHSALIVHLNIVSLDKHFNDLKLFLNRFPKKVEVLCISETRLTDSKKKFVNCLDTTYIIATLKLVQMDPPFMCLTILNANLYPTLKLK